MVLALTYFLCCATHSGPLFHTVSYAISCGLPVAAAVSIYSVEGLAGLVGRVVFGLAGDRFGAKRVLVLGLLVQATAAGSYAFARDLPEFYAVAAVFGLAYAGVMPLYAVIARETFPLAIMGSVIGAAGMVSSMGMALGPLLGGLIYDRYATYAWLYFGSFGLGARGGCYDADLQADHRWPRARHGRDRIIAGRADPCLPARPFVDTFPPPGR